MITSEPWLVWHLFHESEMAPFSECMPQSARKVLDSISIVREACFRQLEFLPVLADSLAVYLFP